MGFWQRASLPFRFLWLAIHPLRRTEEWWGIIGMVATVLIILGVVGAGIAGVVAPSPLPDPSPRWPLIIGYPSVVGFILLFIAGTRLQWRVLSLQGGGATIVFMRGDRATGNMWLQKTVISEREELDRTLPSGKGVSWIYVFIKNDPPEVRSTDKTAIKAVGTVELFDLSDMSRPYMSYFGRWRQNPQVATRPRHVGYEDLAELDLPPNGHPHRLEIALKHPEDDAIYGYNDDSQRYTQDGRYEVLTFKSRVTFVKVGLKGVNVKGHPTSWYRVTHEGSGTEPCIDQIALKDIKRLDHGMEDSQPEGAE